MRSSSFSLFIISLFSINSYIVADAKPTINHNLPKKQSPQRSSSYRDFGLSPALEVNIVRAKNLSINAPHTVEKPFRFPSSVGEYETDDSVNARDLGQYAGYYKLNNTKGARWFYYFFKNDKNAPVVVWLTGGPGCSGSIALFYENGPYRLTKNLSLVTNEYSWSKVSNIIYIDQPTGTGFSYTTDEADIRHTSEEAAVDFYNFIQAFFKKHPEYQNNDFYITGESYAGHYIPAFAAQIQKGNRNSKRIRDIIYINLKGIGIGNGLTNPGPQYKSYPAYAKTMNLINQAQYDSMNDMVSTCLHHFNDCARNGSEMWSCTFAIYTCETIFGSIVDLQDNINYYDIRKKCEGDLCYDFSDMERFLSQKSVKQALGVDQSIPFVSCSDAVHAAMLGDWMKNLEVYVPGLLQDRIKVLIYAGEYDLICNWLGNAMWVDEMKWSGQKGFKSARNIPFMVDGANAGQYKSYGNLTFLKVKNAGHMVPMDQPKASLEMLTRWINGIHL